MTRTDPVLSPATPSGVFAGVQIVVPIAQVAAQTEWRATVPGGVWWRVLCGQVPLVTDATVANRLVGIAVTDGTTEVWRAGVPNPITANATTRISFGPFAGQLENFASPNVATIPIPDLVLPPGYTIGSATGAITVGDRYSAGGLLVQQLEAWPQGPPFGRLDQYEPSDHIERHRHHAG